MSSFLRGAFRMPPLPLLARQTYAYHLKASIPFGIGYGVMLLAGYVAKEALDAGDWHIALLQSSSMLGLLLSLLIYEVVKARSPLKVVVHSWGLAGVAVILMSLLSEATLFIVFAGFYFVLSNAVIPSYTTILRTNYPDSVRGFIVGVLRRWTHIAGGLTALLAGFLLDAHRQSYHFVFLLAGVACLVGVYYFAKIPPRALPVERRIFSLFASFRVLKENRLYVRYLLTIFIAWFSSLMVFPLIVIVLEDRLEARYLIASLVLSVIPNVMVPLTVSWWGQKVDKSKPWAIQSISMLITALGIFCYCIGTIYRSVVPFLVGAVLMGAVRGGLDLVWLLAPAYFAPPHKLAEYSAVNSTLTGVRGLIAPVVGVALASLVGPEFVFLFSAVVMGVCGAFMWHLDRFRIPS